MLEVQYLSEVKVQKKKQIILAMKFSQRGANVHFESSESLVPRPPLAIGPWPDFSPLITNNVTCLEFVTLPPIHVSLIC